MNGLDWNKLLQSRGAALVLYARQWTRSHADAEDAEEGFVRFWRSGKVDGQGENMLPLLFLSVKHAALDGIRSGMRREKREERVMECMQDVNCAFESDLDEKERNQRVQAAIEKLRPEQREVLVMKIWGDLTFKMIAEALQVSINTAASRYRYALEALHGELERNEITHER